MSLAYHAIADPTRRRILELLSIRDMPATGIAAEFIYRQPSISEHLRILREAGLVSVEPRGRQRIYSLVRAPLSEIAGWSGRMAYPVRSTQSEFRLGRLP